MKLKKKLLIELLEIESISGKEDLVVPVIERELKKLGFEWQRDSIGNIFAVRGKAEKYPLLNAHMDIVDINYGYDYAYSKYSGGYSSYSSYYGDSYYDMYNDKYWWEDEAVYESLEDIYDAMSLTEMEHYFTCDNCTKCSTCENCNTFMLCEEFELKADSYDILLMVAEEYGLDIGKKKTSSYLKQNKAKYNAAKSSSATETYSVVEDKGMLKGVGKYRVLGGDDKCGIFIALELARLNRYQPMKLLFTVKEEVGCVGIDFFSKTNSKWFEDVLYSITIDRKYGDNLLWEQCSTRSCKNDFAGRLACAGITVGIPIKLENGSVSDTITIRDLVPNAVNVSAGYYNPHGDDEYVSVEDVTKIVKWLRLFISNEGVE